MVEALGNPVPVGTRTERNVLPTVASSLVVQAGRGPVVAAWTGELLGTDELAEVTVRFEAVPCPDPDPDPDPDGDCTKPDDRFAVLASPHEPPAGAFVPFFNYTLRGLNAGYASGTHTATAVWLPGALTPTGCYRINVRLAHFEGLAHPHAGLRARMLSVHAYKGE